MDAAADLLAATGGDVQITVSAIAERAGVGKQTIYRWWPSKSAVLLDAMVRRAQQAAPIPDTGHLDGDLRDFLRSTYSTAAVHRTLLMGALREALGDVATMERLAAFTAARRDELTRMLNRAEARGEISPMSRPEIVVDQVFGLLWYRMAFVHQPLDEQAAHDLAAALTAQLRTSREG